MVILCSICSDLTFEALWNQDFVFHESLKALVQSAEHRNCAFCSLLWAQIRRECTTDTINLCLAAVLPPPLSKQIEQGDADEESSGQRVIDFKVYLTGFWNPPDLAPYGDMATSLWMNCGKTLKSGSKMSTKLHVFADPGWRLPILFSTGILMMDEQEPQPHHWSLEDILQQTVITVFLSP